MKMYEIKVVMIDQKTRKAHLYTANVPAVSEDAALTAAIHLGYLVNEASGSRLKIDVGKIDAVEIGPSVFN